MSLFQDVLIVAASVCLLYAGVVTVYLSWLLFVKRRALFHEAQDKFFEQLNRVENKLKERE